MAALSPEQARAFRHRWALVEARQREEQRSETLEEKLDALQRLMLSARDFAWDEALDDDAPVRARWARLRQRHLSSGAR
jgi:hypothetical protein